MRPLFTSKEYTVDGSPLHCRPQLERTRSPFAWKIDEILLKTGNVGALRVFCSSNLKLRRDCLGTSSVALLLVFRTYAIYWKFTVLHFW